MFVIPYKVIHSMIELTIPIINVFIRWRNYSTLMFLDKGYKSFHYSINILIIEELIQFCIIDNLTNNIIKHIYCPRRQIMNNRNVTNMRAISFKFFLNLKLQDLP